MLIDIVTPLHPFRGLSAWSLVETRARASGDATAFVWHPYDDGPARRWTFAALRRDAARVAGALQHRGVRPGDRVLVHLENSQEFVLTWLACAAIGAVAVTTNTRSAPDELGYYLGHCQPVGVVTQPRFVGTFEGLDGRGDRWLALGEDLVNEPERPFTPAPPDPTAPVSVQYTSGTTARPKGVVWTHGNALWAARENARHEDLRPDDCQLCYLPLFHANALAYTMLASLWVGARFVLVPRWSTSRFADLSLRYGCTWLSVIGLSGQVLIQQGLPEGHSYRMFGTGVCDAGWDEPFGIKTLGWWGMTETVSHPIVGDPHTPNRPMSMGRPAAGYEVTVVRPDGSPAAVEETGELLVRGVRGLSLFAGYLDDEAATDAAFDDAGWFHTGDLVVAHDDGHLTFRDRAKDMLKVGAENVAASEVERVLAEVPGVLEAAVVGRPDLALDEVPVAFVRVGDEADVDPAAAIAHCAGRLADFKVPRAVHPVRQLPRSTLSKVDKQALRAVAGPGPAADAARIAAERGWLAAARSDPSGDADT